MGGDPVNNSDPFGLCKTANGEERACEVHWVGGERGRPSEAALAHAHRLAQAADVDLYLSDGNRTPNTDCTSDKRTPLSRHNCNLAYDISAIGVDGVVHDLGTDFGAVNLRARIGAIRVSAAALGMPDTREVISSVGIFRKSSSGAVSTSWERGRSPSDWNLFSAHLGHIHISLQSP